MKNLFLIGLILLITSCVAQEKQSELTYENFDQQILDYKPIQNDAPESSYKDALMFLNETQNRIRKNKKADISDYWNILTVFNNVDESNKYIDIAFKKFIQTEGSCAYLISCEVFFERYNDYIESKLRKQLEVCLNDSQNVKKETINIQEYADKNGLDKSLVAVINQVGIADQKDRYNDEVQNKLDRINQQKVDSLYTKYQTYIGKTLVGSQFNSVMWQVIQHSNLTYMEKYLPVVVSAVEKEELGQDALKYLIDRIYSEKYNYQIFGSQGNTKMADDKTRKEVKMKYGIE